MIIDLMSSIKSFQKPDRLVRSTDFNFSAPKDWYCYTVSVDDEFFGRSITGNEFNEHEYNSIEFTYNFGAEIESYTFTDSKPGTSTGG